MTVVDRQCYLKLLRLYDGGVDGIDGPKTQSAMAQFSQLYGVGEDGLLGALAGTVAKRENLSNPWDEIEYFTPSEFRCPCGKCGSTGYEMNIDLIRILDNMRRELNAPIVVSSGFRCSEHNSRVGGVYNSKHLVGAAADVGCASINGYNLNNRFAQVKGIAYHYQIDGSYVHVNL